MPDESGNITAGDANVVTPGPTPVAPDITVGGPNFPGTPPIVGGQTPSSATVPPPPTQHPTFFRRLLFSLGQGLIEGTKAGIQAPLSPQGPAIAARTAIEAPQVRREQLTQQQLDTLKMEKAQVDLATAHYALVHVADERADKYYMASQKFAADLMDKGDAQPLGVGSQADIQKLLAQKKGLNPDNHYLAYANPGSSRGADDEYTLLEVNPKGTFDEDVPEQTIKGMTVKNADGSTITYQDVKIPGIKKGGRIDAWQARAAMSAKLAALNDNTLTRTSIANVAETGRTKRAAAANDVRLKVAELNNITRRAIADQKAAQDQGDKLKISALGKLVTAAKAFGDAQGKIGNKAWETLTDAETKELTTKRAALDEARKVYGDISQKQSKGVADVKGAVSNTKVPKGTKMTPTIAAQYMQKAGGDRAKAMQMARDDNYE